jgi:uncharacterized membrane protein
MPGANENDDAAKPGAIRLDPASIDIFRNAGQKYAEEETKLSKEIGDSGIVGRWIGRVEYQPGNIALIAIVGLLIILLVSILGLIGVDGSQQKGLGKIEDLKSVILAILGLTGTILGYIFGKSSADSPQVKKPDGTKIAP